MAFMMLRCSVIQRSNQRWLCGQNVDGHCAACGGWVMGFYTDLYGVNDVAGSADDEARGDGATT